MASVLSITAMVLFSGPARMANRAGAIIKPSISRGVSRVLIMKLLRCTLSRYSRLMIIDSGEFIVARVF